MKRIAVLGYGNVGKFAVEAILESQDFTLVGIVSRSYAGKEIAGVTVVDDVEKLPEIDVAVLALPTRTVPEMAKKLLAKGIATVDSYDIHTSIVDLRRELDAVAKANNTASIISAGWDPGSDSVVRALMLAMAPKGITYTDFGPGMSMGHSVAVKAIKGVKDALSMTIPLGTGVHRRMVYVEIEEGADPEEIINAIKTDDYFIHDETHVQIVDSVDALKDVGHGVNLERKGVSGKTHNQLLRFEMKINNPALTAQILIASARAVLKQAPGCYTLIEIPPVDLLDMDREDAVRKLV